MKRSKVTRLTQELTLSENHPMYVPVIHILQALWVHDSHQLITSLFICVFNQYYLSSTSHSYFFSEWMNCYILFWSWKTTPACRWRKGVTRRGTLLGKWHASMTMTTVVTQQDTGCPFVPCDGKTCDQIATIQRAVSLYPLSHPFDHTAGRGQVKSNWLHIPILHSPKTMETEQLQVRCSLPVLA